MVFIDQHTETFLLTNGDSEDHPADWIPGERNHVVGNHLKVVT
jgi:hypothetical protein